MKVLFAFLFLLIFAGGAYLTAVYIREGLDGLHRALRRKQRRTGLWELDEESDGEQVIVFCVEPGTEKKLLVGAAPFAAQDFDMQLELLRSEGRQKLVTLNSSRKALGR